MTDFLNEIVGNEKVKTVLTNILLSGNIPHALLFVGPDGVGKENTAIAFTKAVNTNVNDLNLNKKIVHSIESFSEPYIKYILPLPRGKNETDQHDPYEKLSIDEIEIINSEFEKKSKNHFYKIEIPKANLIKISSIRDIKKFLSMNYDDVKYRIILVSQAHLMNEESQNALLKNLEEPPEGVIFILSTSSPEKLRETIRSRCWKINFQPLENNVVSDILVNQFDIERSLADEVAPFSSGSLQEAIDLIENDFEELKEQAIRVLRYSFGKKYHSALSEFEEIISESNQIKAKLLIRMILFWLNDSQKYRFHNETDLFYQKHIETLEKFYTKFPDVQLASTTQSLDKISSTFRNNINLNVAVSNIVFQLSQLTTQN
ncbi:MAG: AAA family ATPase [Ignavibacteriaceae bacterium]